MNVNSVNNENVTDPSDASNGDACEELNLEPSVQRTDVIISHYMPSMFPKHFPKYTAVDPEHTQSNSELNSV